MKYIEGSNRYQLVLYPDMLDDLIPSDSLVRFIDAFVEQLNLADIGFEKTMLLPTSAGRPCYSPECLLKLYIYGYIKKIRSSRKLMEACETNIEVMWLVERLTPDFRTISDFRKDNAGAIKNVFKAFTKMCVDLGLYNRELGVQDGSKFRADNAKDKNVTENKLQKRMEQLEEKITHYLEEMDKLDKEEIDTQKYTKDELQEKIAQLQERKEEYNNLLKEMKERRITQISFTDPDARLMKTANGGFDVCYNTQIIVDAESHIIGGFEVTSQCNDLGMLSPVTTALKEELDIDVMEVSADKGYEDNDDILKCILNGTIPHVPLKSDKEIYEFELEYKEAIITEELCGSTKAEDIKTCLEAGVLPDVYKDKGFEILLQETDSYVSSKDNNNQLLFTLTEDGAAVICPNGSMLTKVSTLHNKGKTRFTSKRACNKCMDKCTKAKFKQVDLADDQKVLYGMSDKKVKKVIIRFTPNKEKVKIRKCVVEHPFGSVKRWNDGSYLLLSSTKKVSAEFALIFLAYNIKRVINMIGTQELIEKMNELQGAIFCIFSNLFKPPKYCIHNRYFLLSLS